MSLYVGLSVSFQQFGKILDVEIIFNERGSKVCHLSSFSAHVSTFVLFLFLVGRKQMICICDIQPSDYKTVNALLMPLSQWAVYLASWPKEPSCVLRRCCIVAWSTQVQDATQSQGEVSRIIWTTLSKGSGVWRRC